MTMTMTTDDNDHNSMATQISCSAFVVGAASKRATAQLAPPKEVSIPRHGMPPSTAAKAFGLSGQNVVLRPIHTGHEFGICPN